MKKLLILVILTLTYMISYGAAEKKITVYGMNEEKILINKIKNNKAEINWIFNCMVKYK